MQPVALPIRGTPAPFSQRQSASLPQLRLASIHSFHTSLQRTASKHRAQLQICGFRRSADWHTKRSSASSSSPTAAARPGPRRDFLEARQVSLFELFDGDAFRFDIPSYQRPYSWRPKQVYELLNDLQTAYFNEQEYFLGAIVTTKPEDGAGVAYQVIDGQQRLTTLIMMLAFLQHWAGAQADGSSLAQRVRRMLHLDADPLEPGSKDRYRLQLRPSDQKFFRDNILEHWLPFSYHLAPSLDSPAAVAAPGPGSHQQGSGLWEEEEEQLLALTGSSSSSSSGGSATAAMSRLGSSGVGLGRATAGASSSGTSGSHKQEKSYPLANESWWRMNCAALCLDRALHKAVGDGMQLPEFMFHVLRNCYIVVMTARDEDASFRIFSTLNGRGMDLSVVDVLKGELLQALPPAKRCPYADRWLELESALGRPGFHRLFDYIQHVELVAAAPPRPHTAQHNGHQQHHWQQQQQGQQRQRHDGQSVLEHWGAKAHSAEDAAAAMDVLFEYARRMLLIRQNMWTDLEEEGGTGPQLAAELEEVCWFMNLFTDDAWAPWTLEFFYQVHDEKKRVAFLRGAETLQLYCELHPDAAFRQERWDQVGAELLKRPLYSDRVLAVLALSAEEQEDMVARLGSRGLAAEADTRTLAHLLLRADSINRRALDWRRLKVEKVLPLAPAEGSLWRRTKMLLHDGSEELPLTASAAANTPASSLVFATVSSSSGGNGSGGGRRASRRRSSSSSLAEGAREVAYWGSSVLREHWHHRLGNLLLVQPVAQRAGGPASHSNADFDAKAAYWAACAADEHFPEFSGGVVAPGGRYSRDRFSPDECRARHGDIIARLVEVLGLRQW